MDGQAYFRRVSSAYYQETFGDLKTLSAFGRASRTERVVKTLDRLLKPASVVADVGCGPAQLSFPLIERGHVYIGVDPNPEMFFPTLEQLRAIPTARFFMGSAEEIPLPDSSVDAVTSVGVVEYLPDRMRALREIHRILRPSGFALFTFPNLRNPVSLIREAMHPLLAPLLRQLFPKLRNTVYVSGIAHAVLWPGAFVRMARNVGFKPIHRSSDGYYPFSFNHRLLRIERPLCVWSDKIGGTLLPGLGNNYYVCLEKG